MLRGSAIVACLLTTLMLAALVGCGGTTGSGSAGGGTPSATAPASGTPTPTPTAFERQLGAIVQPAIGSLARNVSVMFVPATGAATVLTSIDRGANVPATQELVKTVCFRALKALWTSGVAVNDVDVGVLGPFQDDYGNIVMSAYGSADVTARTAATLKWDSLTPEAAWNAYTYVFLAPSYGAGQYWGLPTPTPYPTV